MKRMILKVFATVHDHQRMARIYVSKECRGSIALFLSRLKCRVSFQHLHKAVEDSDAPILAGNVFDAPYLNNLSSQEKKARDRIYLGHRSRSRGDLCDIRSSTRARK